MTICIAAVCNDNNTVVVAADRMVTVPILNLEAERVRSKIVHVAVNQLVMSSGDGLLADEILHGFTPGGIGEIDMSVERFLTAYIHLRQRRVAEQFTLPIGYDMARFQSEGLKNLGPQLFMNAIQLMGGFNLGAEFLFVGFAERTARVAAIMHPGTVRWLDSQEFYAIGSGATHAVTSLMISGHASRWSREQAVLSVYSAKRVAERAPGVGNSTDLQIVTRDGIRSVPEATFTLLDRMYTEQMARPAVVYDALRESIDAAAV